MKNSHLKKTIPFWICLIASIGLLITGFLLPPIGIIDNSVITAVSLLLVFAALGQLPTVIEVAGYAKISSGNTTVEISKEEDNE